MTHAIDVSSLSFPDMQVLGMDTNHSSHILTISMSGAWSGSLIGTGNLVFKCWTGIQQRRYLSKLKTWVVIDSGNEETFKDLTDCDLGQNVSILRGFGMVTGEWLELTINGGKVAFELKND